MKEQEGSTTVIVAILLFVLVGMLAIVVDVGDGMWDRRMLQNSADAAALAIALDCAQADCGEYDETAAAYAGDNNWRGAQVIGITGADGVSPVLPSHGEVTVRTATEGTVENPGRLQQWFGSIFSSEGMRASATATAVWGAAATVDGTLPITVSLCDLESYFPGYELDIVDPAPPPGLRNVDQIPAGPYFGYERGIVIDFHSDSGSDPDPCQTKPGHDANGDGKLPAGWGWLQVAGCELSNLQSNPNGTFEADKRSGTAAPATMACLSDKLGEVALLPVFVDFRQANPRDRYTLYAPVAFLLTGYRFPGSAQPSTALQPCGSPRTCISGHFVTVTSAGSTPTGGIDLGVRAVGLRN